MTTWYSHIDSPLGPLLLTSDGRSLTRLSMARQKHAAAVHRDWQQDAAPFVAARAQLQRYFDGALQAFELPLAPAGTEF
ncbi:MAG: hypothetical protein L0H83_14630, partial [Salinisphaera sp.]|nr:hypothetical protein [Salinisphaera sp.]